jgi:alkenylglycerophosphocholine/alkenylglycerophosphoethanolamine hydrolase
MVDQTGEATSQVSARAASETEVRAITWGAVGVGLFFVGYAAGLPWLRLAAKPVPALALALLAFSRGGPLATPIGAGLVLGAAGDVLLERGATAASPDEAKRFFMLGLVAFLLGHLAYVVGFVRDTKALALGRALPFLLFGSAVLGVAVPKAGPLAAPVAVYGVVIVLMMWRAAARIGTSPAPLAAWLGLLGACSFGFSDSLIAVNKFVGAVPGVRVAIMLTYWGGQTLIALSVPRRQG